MAVAKVTGTWCRDCSVQARQGIQELYTSNTHPYVYIYTQHRSLVYAMR